MSLLPFSRTPRSTLFPYTTLFRSSRAESGSGPTEGEGADLRLPPPSARLRSRRRCEGGGRDRKSTRLNSSHSQISYAVFCLKKKKSKTRRAANEPTRLKRAERTHG